MSENNDNKRNILKLKFKNISEPKKEETKKDIEYNEPIISNEKKNSTEVTKKVQDNISNGFPKIISSETKQSIRPKIFKKRTFIPKNENKFAPPIQSKPTFIKKTFDQKSVFEKKTHFNKFNTENKDSNKKPTFKPKTSILGNTFIKQNTFTALIDKKPFVFDSKKKKTQKKESTKPKISTSTGKVIFGRGRIDDHVLEDPEFIKLKKNRKISATNKTNLIIPRNIEIESSISLKELANMLSIKFDEVLEQASNIGYSGDESTLVDLDILEMIIESFGHKVIRKDFINKEKLSIFNVKINEATATPRAPIVSIVGHVDHGKTSLLDKIRKSALTKAEAGGITQKLSSYSVETKFGPITFLDTPGHFAFSNMRERGININDISILIISGVDGIKDQTIDAIKHIKKTKTNFIIAATKCDLPGFNVDRIKQELTKYEIITKDYGGDIDFIEVSSVSCKNIDLLLETISVYAELLELKANKEAPAVGVILDSKIDNKAGVLTSMLIQQGTLKVGDLCVCNNTFGKIKRIVDDKGKILKEATPCMPVEILGFNECPIPGNQFAVTNNLDLTNELLKYNEEKKIDETSINHSLSLKIKPSLNILLKADSQGSMEALNYSLKNIKTAYSTYKIINSSVGRIKDSDLELAKLGNAVILNYNITIDKNIEYQAKNNGIKIINSKIIYELHDKLESELEILIELIKKEVYSGMALVLKIFKSSKIGNIAGCNVKDGKIIKGEIARVFRRDRMIFEGEIQTLKKSKDDVKEVGLNSDCGIFINFPDIQEGDEIKCYKIEYEKPE